MTFLRKKWILLAFLSFLQPVDVYAGIENDYKRQQIGGGCSYDSAQFYSEFSKYCVLDGYWTEYSNSFKSVRSTGVLNRHTEGLGSIKKVKIEGKKLVEYSCKGTLYSGCKSLVKKKILGWKRNLTKAYSFNTTSNGSFNSLMLSGIAQFRSGNKIKAIKYFSDAIAIDPENADAYAWRGESRMSVSRSNNGCDDIELAISINPNHSGPRYYHRICNHKHY